MHSSSKRTVRCTRVGGGMSSWVGGSALGGDVWGVHLPPVNRITDRCKNITFPKLRLRVVIKPLLTTHVHTQYLLDEIEQQKSHLVTLVGGDVLPLRSGAQYLGVLILRWRCCSLPHRGALRRNQRIYGTKQITRIRIIFHFNFTRSDDIFLFVTK